MAESPSRLSYTLRFAGCAILAFGLSYLSLFHAPNFVEAEPQVHASSQRLDHGTVEYMATHTGHADSANPGRQTVTLPDNWDISRPHFSGYGWYELPFQLSPEKPTPDAVFIPRSIMNSEVYLNGQRIGGFGRMEGELSRNWNKPSLYHFPPSLLKARDNTLQVRVAGYDNYRSGLGRIWIGPHEDLDPLYHQAYLWLVTSSMLASMIALATGIVILMTALFIPHDKTALSYLGLAILVWVARNIGYYQDWAPLPHAQWGQTVHSLHAWFACLYAQFMLQYMGIRKPWLSTLLWGYAIGVTLLIFWVGSDSILQFTTWMLAPIIPGLLVLDGLMLWQSWQKRHSESLLLGFTSMLFLILAIRDLSAMLHQLDYEAVLLSQYTGSLFFFSGAAVVLHRYREAMNELTQSNSRLHQALRAREQQLVAQFSLLRNIEKQRAQDSERRRIMQDIHDGVGSSLVSALITAEARPLGQQEVKDVLQECLDDLRFAIDSLDPESDDLLALLGNFRWRFGRRLQLAGIELLWDVQEVPKLEGYTSREIFDLLRILQEAFGNVLKHAKASHIHLQVQWLGDSEHISLQIEDNGIGMPTGPEEHKGRGLAHMRMRAKAIPAELEWSPGHDGRGTRVHLRFSRARPTRLA